MLKRSLALVALAGVLGWLVASKLTTGSKAKPKKKKGGAESVLVTTHRVEPTTVVDTLSTIGTLKADEAIAIKNEVPGKVVHIGFQEGQKVDRGQILLKMRSSTLRARLKVKKRRRDLLQTQVDRQRQVLDQGGISQHQFDVELNELEIVKAQLDEIRSEIDKTTVEAPFDGIVGLRSVSPGAILTRGTKVAMLRKLDPIEVEFTVPERYAGRLDEGATVKFRTHGSSDIRTARVFALEPALDEQNRSLTARARAENPDGDLRPGAYAQVRVAIERFEDVLTVPTTALRTSAGETTVWVSVDGKAEKRTVETGLRTENRVRILDGLDAGDVVVVTGRQKVKPGAKLEIDESKDAMNVDEIEPSAERPGMHNKWFSEEDFEPDAKGAEADSGEEAP